MTGSTGDRAARIARYRGGHAAVVAALAGVTDAEMDARPADGAWTVREIVHHLADSEMTSALRLRRLLAEDRPVIPGYDENAFARSLHYAERPIGPSLDALAAARATTADILERMGEAEWARSGTHAEIGPYGVEAWFEVYTEHPYDHARQVNVVIAAARGRG